MEIKRLIISLTALTLALAAVGTYAYANDFGWGGQNRQAMKDAIANNDFAAFQTLKGQQFSQEMFDQVKNRQQNRQAIQQAIESGDYQTWKGLMEENDKFALIDTQEEFDKLVQAHQLMEDGDKDGAKALMDELGIMGLGGFHRGFGRSMGGCPYDK